LVALLFVSLAVGFVACSSSGEPESLEEIRAMHAEGRFEETIEPLRARLREQPDDGELNFLYGQALSRSESANLARWSLLKAMQDPDWTVDAGLRVAFLSLAMRDFNEVIEVTDQVLEADPDNAQARLMRASAHAHWKKDLEQAIVEADRVLELDPDIVEAYEPKIIALLDLGRSDEARAAFEEAGDRVRELGAGSSVLAWHCSTMAAMQESAGLLEDAGAQWADCLEQFPSNPEVVRYAVEFYDEQGEPERSLEVLQQAAESGSRAMQMSLANRLVQLGRADEALALLRTRTEEGEPHEVAQAWLDLATMQQSIGDFEAGADSLSLAVEGAKQLGDVDPALSFHYAESLMMAGRDERALEVAETLTVAAHRHLIRGRVAQRRRDPREAQIEFDEALRLWPNNGFARYYAALAAESLGDFARAIEEYRYAIRVDAGATDARLRCARLLDASGEWISASEILHSAYSAAPLDLEGEMLALKLSGLIADSDAVARKLETVRLRWPGRVGNGLAAAAEGVAMRSGPVMALSMLSTAPGVDYSAPHYAPALRALVEYAYAASAIDSFREKLDAIYAARPDDPMIQDVYARDLELAGADAAELRAAYDRAIELAPQYAPALAGRSRVAQTDGDVEAAISLLDRAGAADTHDPAMRIEAARLTLELGRIDEAKLRLDAIIEEYPWAGRAAAERVELDLAQDRVDDRTRDLASRAVKFGGRVDDVEVLARVHALLGDGERAREVEEVARRLREQGARAADSPSAE